MIKVKYTASIFFVIISTFLFTKSDAQSNLLQKKGYLVFGGENNIYTLFFIESNKDFKSLLKYNDTISRFIIGVPGDDASNINSFKIFLTHYKKFDSLEVINVIENNNGIYIEEKSKIYWQKGSIKYFSKQSIPLNEKYEKIIIKSKQIIFRSNKFIPIESFHSQLLSQPKNKKYKKF